MVSLSDLLVASTSSAFTDNHLKSQGNEKNALHPHGLLMALLLPAQTDGDFITINSKDGAKTDYNLTGSQNTVSALRHTADGKMEYTSRASKPLARGDLRC